MLFLCVRSYSFFGAHRLNGGHKINSEILGRRVRQFDLIRTTGNKWNRTMLHCIYNFIVCTRPILYVFAEWKWSAWCMSNFQFPAVACAQSASIAAFLLLFRKYFPCVSLSLAGFVCPPTLVYIEYNWIDTNNIIHMNVIWFVRCTSKMGKINRNDSLSSHLGKSFQSQLMGSKSSSHYKCSTMAKSQNNNNNGRLPRRHVIYILRYEKKSEQEDEEEKNRRLMMKSKSLNWFAVIVRL